MTIADSTFGTGTFGADEDGDVFSNLGFEIGSNGIADRWLTDNFVASSFVPGVFESGGAFEDFETGWSNDEYVTGFEAANLAAGLTEDFENLWQNVGYLKTTMPMAAGVFSADGTGPNPLQVENFEVGWGSNQNYMWTFPESALADDNHAPTDFTDSSMKLVFDPGDLTTGTFSGLRALTVEQFANIQVPQLYAGSAANDTITTNGHNLSVNHRVVFASAIGGALPAPIVAGIPYYVQAVVDANNFKVALTASAGSAINLTGDGSGLLYWSAPYENWTTMMSTV